MMDNKWNLTISASPHVRYSETTGRIMADVLIALAPAMAGSVIFFGLRALLVLLVSAAGCVFFEWGYRRLLKKDCTIADGSAAVTGVLLAMACPPTIPFWAVLIGDFFAIVVVKQLFGGIGKNFVNPALAARAFLFSWPVLMSTWAAPQTALSLFGSNADAVTEATALSYLHGGQMPAQTLLQLFMGNVSGCLGETPALLLLVGALYLVARRVISPRIPLCFLGTVAVVAFLLPQGNDRLVWTAAQLCSGGLMLGACFMATDYVTTPVTRWGQAVFGVGCGLLTMFIRYFGAYAEGISYAILIMNVCVPLLDKIGLPRRFGLTKGGAEK